MTRNTPQLWDKTLPAWDADNPLVCCAIYNETQDVKSFFFRPEAPAQFQFLPGQFITLELPIKGETIHRSYTVSSSPARLHTISITVKRQPNGVVSNWLHDNLKVGDKLAVLPIAGDFSCVHHAADKYLFLSGGSGVTPLMSMSRSFYDLAEDADIVFIHSARSPADIIFAQELALMEARPSFRTAFVCEKGDANWSQPTGYLNIDLLKQIAPDFAQREIFTCGPSPYMAAVRDMLKLASFDMRHYHEESFNFDEMSAHLDEHSETITAPNLPEINEHAVNSKAFSVELTKSGATIDCAPDQFVLNAAHKAGFRLPSACSKGLCGTCKSKLISGKVDMKHKGGIRPREIEQGLFLPCCSKPLSNLVVER
jgi:glycine betaine catabolism B